MSLFSKLFDFLIDLRERHPELEQSDAAAAKVLEEELTQIVDRRICNGCQFVNSAGGIRAGGNLTVAGPIDRRLGEGRRGRGLALLPLLEYGLEPE